MRIAWPARYRSNHMLQSTDLSIIIVNWNTRDLLAQCLSSVVSSSRLKVTSSPAEAATCNLQPATLELFVVDNASTDGSARMVRERFPQVRLIENRENVGFAHANNQAIRRSRGRYVLLLNPDTEVQPGALETLVHFIDAHPQAGARLLNPDGTLQPSCHPAPTLSRELWRLFHLDALAPYACYNMAGWDLETPREVDTVQGACLILRRDALDQVGLLDEDYFMCTEEVDLCYRLRHASLPADHRASSKTETNSSNSCNSWQIYWVPQATVVHYGGQSTRQMPAEMFLRLYESKLLYFRKRHGRPAAQVYKLILLTTALARLLLSPLAWLERSPQRREQHLAPSTGSGQALAGHYRRLVKALPGL